MHEESVSETAENSGEEAGEGALDVEAGEMTDGGEDDYDEAGSHHLVRKKNVDRADREDERKALWEISSGQTVNSPELFISTDLRERAGLHMSER